MSDPTNGAVVCSMNQWQSQGALQPKNLRRSSYVKCSLMRNKSRRDQVGNIQFVELGELCNGDGAKIKQHLLSQFSNQMKFKPVCVLDIPDEYRFMDPDLIEEIKAAVDPIIN